MKNIEKYTNTKDALEAYNSRDFKNIPFNIWLEREYEEPREPSLLEAAEGLIKVWNGHGYRAIAISNNMRVLSAAIEREKSKPVRNKDLENKLETIKKLIENIDLTRCSPVPWRTRSYNCPIGDTGDVYGCTDLFDNNGETILTTDRVNDEDVVVDGWYQEVHLYTAAQAVNAISEIQKILEVKVDEK